MTATRALTALSVITMGICHFLTQIPEAWALKIFTEQGLDVITANANLLFHISLLLALAICFKPELRLVRAEVRKMFGKRRLKAAAKRFMGWTKRVQGNQP